MIFNFTINIANNLTILFLNSFLLPVFVLLHLLLTVSLRISSSSTLNMSFKLF